MADSSLPTISVITPSFNQASFLEQSIRSVLEQDYPAVEHIVIDGGSSDGSVEILKRYENVLAYWVSEPDSGQAEAINKGWRRSSGQILAYLNSDDYYLPGALRTVAQLFIDHPHVGAVQGQARWVDERGSPLRESNMAIEAQQLLDSFGSLPQPAVFVRAAVVERIGYFDQTLHFGLDKDYYLRAVANFPLLSTPEVLACMRVHSSAKSTTATARFAPEIMRVAEKVIRYPELYPRLVIDATRVEAAALVRSARFLYMGGAYTRALRHLCAALRRDRARARDVFLAEIPRLVLRATLGRRSYERLSALLRR
jgi:glycosyltransferase involved in cell wall biosynthesis